MKQVAALVTALSIGTSAAACDTALLLAMDVSNSVDVGEYRMQVDGLARALRDPEVVEILIRDQVALSVLQWSGEDRQEFSLGWTQMRSALAVESFARQVETLKRAYVFSDTAPAAALRAGINYFKSAPPCHRKVIDVSGDGTPNAGGPVGRARRMAERAGITINGLAIEGIGVAITNFYRRSLITRDGFVMTARGHRDYPRAIKAKLLRELSKVLG